jgi:hypothetical protein
MTSSAGENAGTSPGGKVGSLPRTGACAVIGREPVGGVVERRHLLGRPHAAEIVLDLLEQCRVEVAAHLDERAAEELDRHPAGGGAALVATHAIRDRHHTGLRIDEIAILVALALAPRIALPPRPQPHGAHPALPVTPVTANIIDTPHSVR